MTYLNEIIFAMKNNLKTLCQYKDGLLGPQILFLDSNSAPQSQTKDNSMRYDNYRRTSMLDIFGTNFA